jgi:hypothetical protein
MIYISKLLINGLSASAFIIFYGHIMIEKVFDKDKLNNENTSI